MKRLLAVSALFSIMQVVVLHDCCCLFCSGYRPAEPPRVTTSCCGSEKKEKIPQAPRKKCTCAHVEPAKGMTTEPASAIAPELAFWVPVDEPIPAFRTETPPRPENHDPPPDASPLSYPLRR